MMDSCNPWKLEPGSVVMYSRFKVFSTSTMKSEPGRSTILASSAGGGPTSAASCAREGTTAAGRAGAASCAVAAGVFATSAAAPAAAPFRKPRRFTDPFFDLVMVVDLLLASLLIDEQLQ